MRVFILGAGIGGATAAIALARRNIEVIVCERAPEPREVGAGISLWGNALLALRAIGVEQDVLARGERVRGAQIRTPTGRVLSRDDPAWVEARIGAPALLMIHRADLLDALLSRTAPGTVRFGKECVGVDPGSELEPASVRFSDGSVERADLVLGADGIRSVVRREIVNDGEPRYAGYTCWRGICDFPESDWPAGLTAEIWGRGKRIGITRLPGGRVYWWAAANAPRGGRAPDERAALLALYHDWAPPVPSLIEQTPANAILRNDIEDRPPLTPSRWSRARVLLLGDALHPTTPNLGQGGCMAIEDCVILARCLAERTEPSQWLRIRAAIDEYTSRRAPRTARITTTSRYFGMLGHWTNPIACAARNTALALTPKRLPSKQALRLMRVEF
ncbi:MAG: FAD-dependent monooxygenase [Phycisphaerales bacterium]